MKIRFNGMYSKIGPKGCGCGGARKVGRLAFTAHKTFVLPSGRTQTFQLAKEYEVPEEDGRFLLSYTFQDQDGTIFNAFTEV